MRSLKVKVNHDQFSGVKTLSLCGKIRSIFIKLGVEIATLYVKLQYCVLYSIYKQG